MITKLADKWREPHWVEVIDQRGISHSYPNAINESCANELQAALPKWTRITDDPETWPEKVLEKDASIVVFCNTNYHDILPLSGFDFDRKSPVLLYGDWWRPLCDLDFPPEDV